MLEPIVVFVLIVLAVVALDRLLTRQILELFWLLTNSARAAYVTYAVLLLPGTFVHEVSHWLAARVLGVPAARPSVRPRMQADTVVLGEVRTARTDPVRQSLIGAAPIFVGATLIVLIAQNVFGFEGPEALWPGAEGLAALVDRLQTALRVEDAWLWLYLLFSISNVMLPSESDRVAWPRLLFLIVCLVGSIVVLVGVPQVPSFVRLVAVSAIRALTFAFLLTIVIDVPVFAAFWLGTQVVALVRR